MSAGVARPAVTAAEPGARWDDGALCAQLGQELWFPEHGHRGATAKRICAACPVQPECLAYAMRVEAGVHHNLRSGIWGGLDHRQRYALERARVAAGEVVAP